MKTKIYTSILILGILLAGCHHDCIETDSNFDELAMDAYYETEIFNQTFTEVYGNWKLYEVTGGIHGGGHDLNFDFLSIKKYGIYAFIKDDNILEFGRIHIDDQTNESLSITFNPHPKSEIFMYDSEKIITLQVNDTLFLDSPCCDRFNYHFSRVMMRD
jgi:hypothetical protein